MRIACSPEEMASGCVGGGPYWEWLPTLPPQPLFDERALHAALAAEEALPPLFGSAGVESLSATGAVE
jgi:hypothetical protein